MGYKRKEEEEQKRRPNFDTYCNTESHCISPQSRSANEQLTKINYGPIMTEQSYLTPSIDGIDYECRLR